MTSTLTVVMTTRGDKLHAAEVARTGRRALCGGTIDAVLESTPLTSVTCKRCLAHLGGA